MNEGLTQHNLYERYMGFPSGLTYPDFKMLPENLRRTIIGNNRILQTDTYNRTMEYVQGPEWSTPETYALQLRTAREGYLIVYGIREQLENIASVRITQQELDFAKDYYKDNGNIRFFNADKWQEIIDKNGGKLPIEVDAVADGTAILPGDPVMRIKGPGELVAHFEPNFHRIFYPSRVATIAHEIDLKIGRNRFIEVGKRGTPTEADHLIAVSAMFVGGGINQTSNDAAAVCYEPLMERGTIGHRYIQSGLTEEAAFRKAIESLDSVALLVDLHNSINGIELAIKLKKEYRATGKRIWIRLDSGDVSAQTLYTLKRFREEGLTDTLLDKIIVESIEAVDEMSSIDERAVQAGFDPVSHVLYGAGELLVSKNTGRSFASTGFKVTQRDGRDTMKFSDSIGKASFPGSPTLVDLNGQRIIAQVGEFPASRDLLIPAYRDGEILFKEDLAEARRVAETSFEGIEPFVRAGVKSNISPQTQAKMEEFRQLHAIEQGNL